MVSTAVVAAHVILRFSHGYISIVESMRAPKRFRKRRLDPNRVTAQSVFKSFNVVRIHGVPSRVEASGL